MTRVIHTGDTHIGYQQYNSPARRSDFLSAFRAVARDAIDDDVDAVVHAGDLFHDRRPGLPDLQGTLGVLRELADAGIPFLAIVGNHETKRDAQWLDLFEDLGFATRLGRDPTVVDDVAFYGLDYVPQSRRDELAYDFEPIPDTADRAILVAHGLFEPFAHATWDTDAVLGESTVDFDAVLLGDNHAPGTETVADTWVTYCGSTERASASEREPRGYNLVSVDDDVSITRRAIETAREFVFVDVELTGDEGIDRVRDRLSQYDVDDAVVIVTIDGDGEPVSPAPIEEYALERGALVARANDRRDLPDDAEDVRVSFADPDVAVTERLRDLGVSDGARTIDGVVRDDTIADSNVRETVSRRVRDALGSDGLEFSDAPVLADPNSDEPSTTDSGVESDPPADDTDGVTTPDETGPPSSQTADESESERETGNPSTRPAADASTSDEPDDGVPAEQEPTRESDEVSGDDSDDGSPNGSADDDQVSIGDFA
ncbi:DNA double-strand break repair protein Mre11 [Halovivax cerinus]|uniref:DNA double-strand break repair protein Mre11 n=1 Tax=Halovivax cerinus TaxID=1487865 RepID=A0ABD5NJI7_9EURY|nr:DNA double-strand break repair protein Mre11 [Halovivax cerinus]